MTSVLTDLRYGVRRLVSNPAFTMAAVATLALGIGANTAIYSVVDSLLLRPLPYRSPERLVQPQWALPAGFMRTDLGLDAFLAVRAEQELFERVEAFDARSQTFQGSGEPEHLMTAALTGGMMEMLGVRPLRGRILVDEDARPDAANVAVIAEALWRRQFNASEDIVGRTMRLDDRTYEIVGVMPGSFRFPYMNRQVWVPFPLSHETAGRRTRYEAVARLKDGVTVDAARQRLKTVRPVDAGGPRAGSFALEPYMARRVNRPVEQALYALLGAVAVLLLIASANVANLLLVQAAGREREIAVRASLGAGRARLVRQLLTETLLLALVGGGAGVLLAVWGVDLLTAAAPRELTFFSSAEIRVDARSLAFALAATTAAAVLFGTLPALRSSHAVLHDALRAGARQSSSTRRQIRIRGAFVVAQLALSVLLLVGAALLTRTFVTLTRIDPGFETTGLLAAGVSLPAWKYPTPASRTLMVERVLERLRSTPGIEAVTRSDGVPPGGGGVGFGLRIEIQGRGVVLDDPQVLLPMTTVAPDYFDVLRIPILRGRAFTATDAASRESPIVLNETMARRLWGGADPVGDRIRLRSEGTWHTVIGVAGDVFQFDHSKPRDLLGVYFPQGATVTDAYVTFVARAAGDTQAAVAAVKAQIWGVDPGQPIHRLETAREMYEEFFAGPRFYAALMVLFGLVGLLMAAVGLYGVLAYSLAERAREFGIRLALGATPADILRLALRHGATLTIAGLTVGALASMLVRPALASMLVGVTPGDPVAYISALAVLSAAALVACWLPGWRATHADPAAALRHE